MGRPIKDGIDYFPLDSDIFSDDKIRLLLAEYGSPGLTVYLYVLCDIYRSSGYYKLWDEDARLLTSGALPGDCSPSLTEEIIAGCVKRGLFDDTLYRSFRVLSSAGIQRRYIKACSKRDEIRMIHEYFLLDLTSKRDVTESEKNKIKYIPLMHDRVSSGINGVNSEKNEVNFKKNPQSKVNRNNSILNNSKVPTPPSLSEIRAYCEQNGIAIDCESFFYYNENRKWNGLRKYNGDFRPLIDLWYQRERNNRKDEEKPLNPEIQEIWDNAMVELEAYNGPEE